MLTRAVKDQQVKEFNAAFKTNPSVMVVEYKGLSVNEMEKLRKNVRKAQAELKVVKNTLLKIAAKDTVIEQIDELFEGPTAVAICESDPSAVAKVFVNTIKDAPMLKLKGGFVDGSVLDAGAISELSKLPSRPEMIAQFMGLLKAPMSNFVGALTQMQTKLLYALEALKETKEALKEEPEKAAAEDSKDAQKGAEESVEEAKEQTQEAQSESEEAQEAPVESKEADAKSQEPAQEAEQAEETAQDAVASSEEVQKAAEDTGEEAPEAQEAQEQQPEQAEEAAQESEEEK